jgi:hypothetical protein
MTAVELTFPDESHSVVQKHNEDDQRNRDSDEPKQNRHGVSPFVFEG